MKIVRNNLKLLQYIVYVKQTEDKNKAGKNYIGEVKLKNLVSTKAKDFTEYGYTFMDNLSNDIKVIKVNKK